MSMSRSLLSPVFLSPSAPSMSPSLTPRALQADTESDAVGWVEDLTRAIAMAEAKAKSLDNAAAVLKEESALAGATGGAGAGGDAAGDAAAPEPAPPTPVTPTTLSTPTTPSTPSRGCNFLAAMAGVPLS